jgi:ankyrin repeat protein
MNASADVHVKTINGETVLDIGVLYQNHTIVELLERYHAINLCSIEDIVAQSSKNFRF